MLWVSWVLLVSVLTGDVAAIKFFNYNLISVLFLGNEGSIWLIRQLRKERVNVSSTSYILALIVLDHYE